MSAPLRCALAGALAAALLGCVREYRAPRPDEPHATMKIRRVHEKSAGQMLRETCEVNGAVALSETGPSDAAGAPHTGAFLIGPVPARLRCGSRFVHTESRMVTETYTVQVPYSTTESYPCGTSTCMRSVTRSRSETRTRTVLRNVEVTDAACDRALLLAPQIGRVYLVDFTYQDNGVCNAACYEQLPGDQPGTFQNVACPAPSPEEAAKLPHDD